MPGNQTCDWRLDATIGGDAPWQKTKDQILKTMHEDGGWFRFSEYDNYTAVLDLVVEGAIRLDQNWNNRVSGMVTSLRAKVANHD